MDELIYNLRRLSEWTAKELWENPVNFPEGVLKQAADELEKAREIVVLWDMYGGSEGITDAFERAEKARWIPVEERLPEPGGKDEIRQMSNEDLVSRFVAYVGADYKTDYAPHIHPRFSKETREMWGEVEQRMSGVVTLGFDRKFFEKAMYEETKIQKDIIERNPDKLTSYHSGIRSGLNLAFKIAMESMKVEQEEEAKS